MLELILTAPRLLLGALGDLVVGFLIALALYLVYPAMPITAGVLVVAILLSIGVAVGATWQGKHS